MLVAHPLTGSQPLPVPPLVLAAATVVLAALVATRVRAAAPPAEAPVERTPPARWLALPRLASAAVLLLLVAVARLGDDREPRNLAAVAVVHLAWPLLLVASALAGPVLWRAVDPWYALGAAERLLGAPPRPPTAAPLPVWPAVVAGGTWATFIGWYALSVDPRALSAMLAGYTLALLAGSLALGRDSWLRSADALGLVVSWTGLLRRARLVTWVPPPGATALLGAVFGGVAFTRLRLSPAWTRVALSDHPLLWHRLGAVAAVVLGATIAVVAGRWAARRGAYGSVAAALVPVVAATAVALPLRRLMVAAQLLPHLARVGDRRVVDLNPWGTGVQQGLAASLIALGAVAGAWVLARRVRDVRARDPAALTVYVTSFAATLLAVSGP